jgi:hypothetical protein
MGIHGKLAGTGDRLPTAEALVHYEALEECILSGQVTYAEVQGLLSEEPEFARWFMARVPYRLRGCVSSAI